MIFYLIGMMGSGKSSVGKLLANKLKFSIIDIDKEIEKNEKLSIKEIFEKKGENYFREIENFKEYRMKLILSESINNSMDLLKEISEKFSSKENITL